MIEEAYNNIRTSYMLVFDEYMDEIKDRILKHLRAKDGGTIGAHYSYNAGIVLDRIGQKIEKFYEELNVEDLNKFEAVTITATC